ncbi:uncharacterized protein LOC117785090 [Drosophila innubila]|uniref:uncharacterized protein LOC117785090 n=1 Tax=Drosophila innubila TaxID=198719 RepID=UPI00148CD2C2|nr:uncharacterized protein LOC117785090 [Drosophila innubila]
MQRSREMKHFQIAIIVVLSVLARDLLVSSATGCPRRYLRRINGKCYYFSVKKMNWFGALSNCLRKGLTLADLSNPKDFYGAIDFLSSKGNMEDFWFGGNDLQTEGRYQYISNGRLVKYYGNYSVVDPAEHSGCDDCLEVRIRTNMTVVADDNCLERQYFICSERYCDQVNAKKPRHHSHEHLHHFHHDIGEPSEEIEQDLNTPSPFDSAPDESIKNESEQDILPEDVPDETSPDAESSEPEEGATDATEVTAAAEHATVAGEEDKAAEGEAESSTAASPTAEESNAPAAEEGEAPAPAAEATAAEGEAPAAEGEAPAAEGEAPAAEGEPTPSKRR